MEFHEILGAVQERKPLVQCITNFVTVNDCANILLAAQESVGSGGRVLALFQPHGYGPFGFMADELGKNLQKILRQQDQLYLAEPFYAGGTSSFSPHASEVLERWKKTAPGLPVELFSSRQDLAEQLLRQASSADLILIMGARDNTLSEFASSLTV